MKAGLLLPEWSCLKCTARMKTIRGCGEPGTGVTLLGDEKLTICPLLYVRDDRAGFLRVMGHWAMFQKGFLPEPGGTEDQQAQIMKAIMIADRAVNEVRQAKRAPPAQGSGGSSGGRNGRGAG